MYAMSVNEITWHFGVRPVSWILVLKQWPHVALRARNSGAEGGRELFKGLKDAVVSLLVW